MSISNESPVKYVNGGQIKPICKKLQQVEYNIVSAISNHSIVAFMPYSHTQIVISSYLIHNRISYMMFYDI